MIAPATPKEKSRDHNIVNIGSIYTPSMSNSQFKFRYPGTEDIVSEYVDILRLNSFSNLSTSFTDLTFSVYHHLTYGYLLVTSKNELVLVNIPKINFVDHVVKCCPARSSTLVEGASEQEEYEYFLFMENNLVLAFNRKLISYKMAKPEFLEEMVQQNVINYQNSVILK